MKKTIFRFSAAHALLVLASIVLISGCGVGEASVDNPEVAQDAVPVPVEIALPVQADIFATYPATARISSDSDAPVVTKVAGEVVELLAEEGDQVSAGQVLVRLDGERLRLELLESKANLRRAEKEYQRNVDLHNRGLVSDSMFEGLKFDLASLEATYALKRLNYGYSHVRATISGTVSSRMIKPGQNLAVGQVAFRVTETSELIAHLQIPQVELSKFEPGQAASVEVASIPGSRFAAVVARVSPTIDARNGTFRATAVIDNTDGDLAPGMFGRFRIAYEKHADALLIPTRAILDEDDESTVYVVVNGEVFRRVVTTGIESDGQTEILGGLEKDEQVVVVGHSSLREGSKVLASLPDLDSFTG